MKMKEVAGNLKTSPYGGETPFSLVSGMRQGHQRGKANTITTTKTPGHEDKLPFFIFLLNCL